ncbi:MAG: hypothetical protein FWG64_06280 [Firmicutes bacterium]|nr:hypothetical protein [Bacillota bacterium]
MFNRFKKFLGVDPNGFYHHIPYLNEIELEYWVYKKCKDNYKGNYNKLLRKTEDKFMEEKDTNRVKTALLLQKRILDEKKSYIGVKFPMIVSVTAPIIAIFTFLFTSKYNKFST